MTTATCTEGQSSACVGPNSCTGYQTCNAGGTYDACICPTKPQDGGTATESDGGVDTGSIGQGDASVDGMTHHGDAGDASDEILDTGSEADAPSCNTSTSPSSDATYLSDPVATETTTARGFTLHKELNAYSNYGAADDAADIVYEGQVGAWTFAIPTAAIKSATAVFSLVADDHGTVLADEYMYQIWSGTCEYDGTTALPHGSPANSMFTNWVQVSEPANPISGGNFTVTLSNTSTTGSTTNWIGVDWIEIQVVSE